MNCRHFKKISVFKGLTGLIACIGAVVIKIDLVTNFTKFSI